MDSDSDSEPGPSAPKKRIIFGDDSSSDSDSGPDDRSKELRQFNIYKMHSNINLVLVKSL